MDNHLVRRRLLRTAIALGFLFSSACNAAAGPSGSQTPRPPAGREQPPAPTDHAPVTITFWHSYAGNTRTLLNALANDFQKAYPWITVRGEAKDSDGDLLRQGIAAMALNQLPDFMIASPRTIGEFARKDTLFALDVFLEDSAIGIPSDARSDFFPGLLESGRFPDLKNKLYAFPFDERAAVLYYNVDLLKAAQAPPRTWDDFSNAARSVTKGDVRGWVMTPNAAVYGAFLWSRGGNVLNEAQTQAQFNDEAGLKALQLIAALSRGGAAYLADTADNARNDFAQGKTALLFGSTDELLSVSNAVDRANKNFQWGVANVPQNDPSHPFTTIFGTSIAIFKPVPSPSAGQALSGANGTSDARARAAWLFTRWLTAPEQTARWSRSTLSIPLRTSALAFLASNAPAVGALRDAPLLQRLRDGFDVPPAGRSMPNIKDAGMIDAALVEMWTAVAKGEDPAAALNRAATRVNRILGQTP